MRRKITPFLLLLIFLFFSLCAENDDSKKENINEKVLKPEFPLQGKIVFQSNMDGDNEIYLLTKKGIKKLTDNTWNDGYPLWSPDGKKIAYSSNPRGNNDIFIMNHDGTGVIAVTSSKQNEGEPSWFPDGKSICFSRVTKKFLRKQSALFRVYLESRRTERIIPQYSKINAIAHVSPTSPLITFTGKRTMGWDVAVYDMHKREVKFLNEDGNSCRARFSKDGKKLAYVYKGDIWIMNPDGSQKTRLTKRDKTHDYFPSWSSDGKYIVFNSSHQTNHEGDWQLYVIEVESKRVFPLFDSPGNDVFPDWY